ncbi:MAG: hypothetical protein U0359_17875 [Byssovorax sp.]
MEIRTDVTLPFPRDQVFVAYRDHLVELAAFLPNIRSITVKSRDESPGEVRLVNAWVGGGDIPKVARAFLSESMLAWLDHATWKDDGHRVVWRTEVGVLPGALKSSGENRFLALPDGGTRIEFRGDLTCDTAKVPGVPRLLAGSLNGTIEKIFVGKVEDNLLAIGKGLQQFLAARPG